MNGMSYPLTDKQWRAKKLSLIALLVMILGSLGVDQVTKITAEKHLLVWQDPTDLKAYQGRRVPVWSLGTWTAPEEEPQFYFSFSFNYVRNQGAAWGFLSDWEDAYRVPFFYSITFIAVLVIFYYMKSTPLRHRLARFSLGLIASGAVGNFCDRLVRGYVIDFLDCRWILPLPFPLNLDLSGLPRVLDFFQVQVQANAWRYSFPNFNWADSTITVGVFLLIYDMLVLEQIRKRHFLAKANLS